MATKLEEAAGEVERARKALERARRRLATQSKRTKGPATVLTGEWKRAQLLLAKHRTALVSYDNVVATALGYRHKAKAERKEICVVVFVREKVAKEEIRKRGWKALPRTLRDGRTRIGIDVVELHKVRKHDAEDAIGSIGTDSNHPTAGTIGALGRDRDSGDAVVITAMHVTDHDTLAGSIPMTIPSRKDHPNPPGRGEVTGGTRDGVDAAKVRVDDVKAVRPFLPPITIAGWRRPSNDVNSTVRMYGSRSRMLSGVVKFLNFDLVDDGFPFHDALLVSIATQPGDSGASIVDNSDLILGFLFGLAPSDLGDFRVFSPASLVLDTLRCDITPI